MRPTPADPPAPAPAGDRRAPGKPPVLAAATIAAALAPLWTASASEPVPLLDRFNLAVGVYAANSDLSGRWDSRSGRRGTPFSFRRDLGFDGKVRVPFWQAGLGLGAQRRLRIDLFHFALEDDGSRRLERVFELGDDTYSAGALLDASLDTEYTGAALSWYVRHTAVSAAAIGVGVVDYRVRAELSAEVIVAGSSTVVGSAFDEQAWAPMVRGAYTRRLGDHWRMHLVAAYISADLDNVGGHVSDAHVEFDWFPHERVGLALRYTFNEVDVDLDRRSYSGNIRLRSHGPQLFAKLRF